jgi:hypothetical protein
MFYPSFVPMSVLIALAIAFNAACSDAENKTATPQRDPIILIIDGPGSSQKPDPVVIAAHLAEPAPNAPALTLKATIAENGEQLLLTIRLRNTGRTPIVVDKDLVLLPSIMLLGENRQAIPFQHLKTVEKPSVAALKSRLIVLKPGSEIERQLDLKKGFRSFVTGIGSSAPAGGGVLHQPTAYEADHRIPENVRPKEISISFSPPYSFEEGFAQYLEGIDTKESYRGPLSATIPDQAQATD